MCQIKDSQYSSDYFHCYFEAEASLFTFIIRVTDVTDVTAQESFPSSQKFQQTSPPSRSIRRFHFIHKCQRDIKSISCGREKYKDRTLTGC